MLSQETQKLLELRDLKREREAQLKKAISDLRHQEGVVIEQMREAGFDAIKQHNTSFSVTNKLIASRTDDEALFDWLEENGYGAVIKRTVHHMTLNKVVRESLEEEGEQPPGVEVNFFDVLAIRKA